MAAKALRGWRKALGGVIPKIRSRIIPPPTAVVSPKMHTPKISIRFFTPTSAPDRAKDTVPIHSNNAINQYIFASLSIFPGHRPVF